ncbi:hypothetical protein EON63_05205 [archaeon]|nr:MAG: hypothetical protein EON63_05205 [archaeon]
MHKTSVQPYYIIIFIPYINIIHTRHTIIATHIRHTIHTIQPYTYRKYAFSTYTHIHIHKHT